MENDDTLNESLINESSLDESFPAKDIVFECGGCGKSLVINALGAGLAVTCPDCGTEQQVPLAGDVEVANPAVEPNAATAVADEQEVEHELPEISDVLADAREQINALTLKNDELQFRRRFLEKRHALASQSLQTLRREMITIRKAMDRTEAILQTMEDPSAGDTQPIA